MDCATPPPFEIGNLVWSDIDQDGIQDACEPGIQGVSVNLYDATGTLLASTQTDANGQYYFGKDGDLNQIWETADDAVQPNTTYHIAVGMGQFASDQLTIGGNTYLLTVDSTDSGANRFYRDSDAEVVATSPGNAFDGLPATQITTGESGCVDHTFDFGFFPAALSLGNLVWDDVNNDGSSSGETGVDGVEVILFNLGADNTKGTVDDVGLDTMTTAGGGLYLFENLLPGDYYVKLNSGIPAGMISSTGEGTATISGTGAFEPGASDDTNGDDNGSQMGTMIMSSVINLAIGSEPTDDGDTDDNSNLSVDFGLIDCPTVDALAVTAGSDEHLCSPTTTTTSLSANTTSWEGLDVEFVYSTSTLTDPYTEASTSLGTATVAAGDAVLATATFPTNTTTAPIVYNVYAILSSSPSMVCNTFASTTVTIHPALTAGLDNMGTVCNNNTEGISIIDLNGMLSAGTTPGGTWTRTDGGTEGTFDAMAGTYDADGVTVGGTPVLATFKYTVTGDANAPAPCDTDDADFTVTIANCCPVITMSVTDPNPATLCSSTETFDLTIEHELNPGQLSVFYNTGAVAPANMIYDMVAAGQMTLLTDAKLHPAPATSTTLTGLSLPMNTTSAPIVYNVYAVLDSGNGSIDGDASDGFVCIPMQVVQVTVNQETPTATLENGTVCSYDSPYTAGTDNSIDLSTLITSGPTDGTWADDDATGQLVGPIFTPTPVMEGMTYNFTYTINGVEMGMGGTCDPSVYTIQVTVEDCFASIGDKTWVDANYNGEQDLGEAPVGGIQVVLSGTTLGGDPIADVTMTDGAGMYLFDLLPPGDYKLTFNPMDPDLNLTGYNANTNADDTIDSDADPANANMTVLETLVAGEENTDYDAGFFTYGKVGDYVWEDVNGNGIQDAGEPGIEGVDVTLSGTDGLGNPVSITVQTDATGMYMIGDLPPGEYKVTFSQPVGYMPTENDDPASNGDDTSDSDADPNNGLMTPMFTLASADTIPDIDAGFLTLGKIGDLVWEDSNANGVQDAGEPGIENVDVTLTGTDGLGNAVTATAFTDATGMYMFGDLWPGEYKVTFAQPVGYMPTANDDPASNGDDTNDSDADPVNALMTPMVSLASGDTIPDLDAGFYVYGKIGDLVWEDTNGNGIQDAGEPGIENVDVTLTGTDGLGNVVSTTIQTDATGMYMFGDLVPGDYKVTFAQPAGYEATAPDDPASNGDDTSDSDADPNNALMTPVVTITSADTIPDLDAGFLVLGKIGDYVWEDLNANGIQDAGEPGIENVDVTLTGTDGLGNAVSTTVQTDATGMYMFGDLWPGDYKVTFGQPTDFEPTVLDDPLGLGDDTNDSDADPNNGLMTPVVTLESSDTIPTLDAGFYEFAKIGNFVWEDLNFNGIQDAGEPGIQGVDVALSGTDAQGNAVNLTAQTDGTGMYMFGNLLPGGYKLTFSTPVGYVPTANDDPNGNGDDTSDSDADFGNGGMTVFETLISGENNPDYDAGFYRPAKIGNLVWEDSNYNGIQDAGEPGIGGVDVQLTGTDGMGNTVDLTTQTDGTGMYMFGGLAPGVYKLTFSQPAGYEPTGLDDPTTIGDDSNDSDADPVTGMTVFETLVSGEDNADYDAGFYQPAKIGDFVWEDLNANGVMDAAEPGIPNVNVTLTGTDGLGNTVTLTTSSDGTGMYMFGGLAPGDYKLTFETPSGFTPTANDDPSGNGDETNDSDADTVTGMTVFETLVSGENNPDYDAGFYTLGKIGDYVWEDLNGNGIQDTGEPPMEGVEVTLNGTDGLGNAVMATTTTDGTGMYMFGDLVPGDYKVTFSQPTGYEPTASNDPSVNGDDTTDSDADETTGMTQIVTLESADTVPTLDAGYLVLGKIGDYVWEDLNANGIQDAGEPAIEGVEVSLSGTDGLGNAVTATAFTDATGMYMFGDLVPGDYVVTFSGPVGYEPTANDDPNAIGDDSTDSDADPTTGVAPGVTIVSADTIPTIDAGYYVLGKIGDYVWEDLNGNGIQDIGEPPMEGVEVTLNGTDGLGNAVMATTTTDGTGMYMFGDLVPGDYKVTFSQPTGYEPTANDDPSVNGDDTTDSDADETTGMTQIVTLESADTVPTLDAGYLVLGKIGDYVWEDLNANGIQDAGEPAIEGVEVSLSGTDGLGNAVTATAFTDATGMYMFGDLWPGEYAVTFAQPTGYEATGNEEGGDDASDSDADPATGVAPGVTIVSADTIPTIDAGYYVLGKIGDYVWEDLNGNGIQDAGEPAIEGVEVSLSGTDGLGNVVMATTTTDGTGMYMFGDLVPGEYTVTFAQPTGYEATGNEEGGDDASDSDADPATGVAPGVTIVSADTIPTIDAGYYVLGKIGDYVWEDLNGNGIQDIGEPPMEGVEVTLNGTDGLGNAVMATTTTDGTGMYMFGDLVPGDYKVTFSQPTGYEPTANDDPNAIGDDSTDSDADPTTGVAPGVTIVSADTIPTIDAGYYVLGKIGDYVWEDLNGNGIQDIGEPPMEGVEVTLNGTDGLGNAVMATTTTDGTGMYMFGDLVPGDYKVTFSQPTGYEPTANDDPSGFGDDTTDSDAAVNNGLMTPILTLESGDTIPHLDAGFYILGKIGDLVWEDLNANGVQDLGEPGLENVEVTLTGTDGLGNPISAVAGNTDGTGMYMFGDLVPGEYKVTFGQPAGFVPTALDDPSGNGDDTTDSDADPNNGLMTPLTTLTSGDTIPTLDAGFYVYAKLGDLVWEDLNANGIQDTDYQGNADPGIPNVEVTLTGTDGLGNAVTSTTQTDGTGMYMFGDLVPGEYKVTFGQPDDFFPTVVDDPLGLGDDSLDSDADPNNGLMTTMLTLVSRDTVPTLDAGFYQTASIGNYVWYDTDLDGEQDTGEPGLEGVDVTLDGTDAQGNMVNQVTQTDADGLYLFEDLVPGEYKLTFQAFAVTTITEYQAPGVDTTLNSDADPTMGNMTTYEILVSNEENLTYDAGGYVLDFGDLPDSFHTLLDANDGARHSYDLNPIYFGNCVDAELNGAPDAIAGTDGTSGDDNVQSDFAIGNCSGNDDEDGVRFVSPLIPGEQACIEITTYVEMGTAFINAWIDFNGDGDFEGDTNEKVEFSVLNGVAITATPNALAPNGSATQVFCFEVPSTATFAGAETHFRFRISPTADMPYDGNVIGGEVEDYWLPMAKVGNLVWRDADYDGEQDAGLDFGINDMEVKLTSAGSDEVLGTSDDYVYSTVTEEMNGNDGMYMFLGITPGNYQIESIGDGSLPTLVDIVDDFIDNDPEVITFTINNPSNDLPQGENGLGDIPGADFPDRNDDLSFDFGYVGLDFGDLPETFGTMMDGDGARHVMIPGMYLGSCVDFESDGRPDEQAGDDGINGDNEDSPYTIGNCVATGNDENGITLLTPMIPGEIACIEVTHTSLNVYAQLNAFIDFNGDGDFFGDPNEQLIFISVNGNDISPSINGPLPQGTAITQEMCFEVPSSATFDGGETHMRFRMSEQGNLSYNGMAVSGEVEDYWSPFAKAANLVWKDEDLEGDQNEALASPINDFEVQLVYYGTDGVFGNSDDRIFSTTTAALNGIGGQYRFCGLIRGTYRVQYLTFPQGMIPAIPNHVDDMEDSDGLFTEFTVTNVPMDLTENETSVGDSPTTDNYPDVQDDYTFDFAFIDEPTLAASLGIAGVDLASSATCGHFNATFDLCLKNTGVADLNNLQAVIDFSASSAFGSAFEEMVAAPQIVSNTASTAPNLNAVFNGAAQSNLFDGTSGLLESGQQICLRFTIEINPSAAGAPASPQIQAMVSGGAVNDSGVEIPDLINGGQFMATDDSDTGFDPMTTNEGQPGDSGGANDPTLLTDCWNSNNTPACNDLVNVSLDENCEADILADMILEGVPSDCLDEQFPLGGYFQVEIKTQSGVPVSNPVTGDFLGETLIVTAINVVNCNSCWGQIYLEDKLGPVIDCPTDPFEVNCDEEISETTPMAFEPCEIGQFPAEFLVETVADPVACDDDMVVIQRTYTAFDASGNEAEHCIVDINVQRAEVDFPDDIFWTCEQYAAYASITQPTELHPFVTDTDLSTSIIDVNLDPLCDDDDNPLFDQVDINSTNVENGGNGCPGTGLDDEDVLALTGSGFPGGTDGQYCQRDVSYEDIIIEECGDGFKILRTWTVIDHCTGEIITSNSFGEDHLQVIKVLDRKAPTVTVPDFILTTNGSSLDCTSQGELPAPDVLDNCTETTVRIVTNAGEAIYNNGVEGSEGGIVPAPGLGLGTHIIIYEVTDECGNQTVMEKTVEVMDAVVPVVVCDEITAVSLSSNGEADVSASVFDDGSYDNCCLDDFLVRRMSQPVSAFAPSVIFTCDDIGSPVMVVVRVLDCLGNHAECMVEVNVEDKLPPILVSCPANQRILCDYFAEMYETQIDNLSSNPEAQSELFNDGFGEATFLDNCEFEVNYGFSQNIDQCLEGTLTRTWVAEDPQGAVSQTCTQTISVDHVSDWVVEFPADISVECGTSVPDFGEPEIFFESCELVAVSFEDVIYTTVPDACYKIARTWTVINWCVVGNSIDEEVEEQPENQLNLPFPLCDLDGDGDCDDRTFRDSWRNAIYPDASIATQVTGPDTDFDSDPWDGYITYQQVINVEDSVDPVFANDCDIPDVCIDGGGCTTSLSLPTPEVDDCSEHLDLSVSSDLGAGFGPFVNVAPGIYEVTYTATDNCNNQTACETTVTVSDCKKPTPYCKNGIIIELMMSGMAEVWAIDLNDNSFDNCTPQPELEFSFSDNVGDDNLTLTCDEVGQYPVEIWVTDEAGNQDFCQTFIIVQANMGQCNPGDDPQIAGRIATEEDETVEAVEVQLSGSDQQTVMTQADGMFSFNVPEGGDYSLTPVKDDEPLNGVTTFDLLLITKHILGSQTLDSPYKMIAADVNNSKSITTFDVLLLRKLILFIDLEFQNNTSWRFVDRAYEFPNPTDPWVEEFPEVVSVNDLDADLMGADFVAVKIGDVNGSVTANLFGGVEERNATGALVFEVDDQFLAEGEEVEIKFTSEDFHVSGFQFTMDFDPLKLDFVNVTPALANVENFGFRHLEKGFITASWNGNQAVKLSKKEAVFNIRFKAKTDTWLSRSIDLNSAYTLAEAYRPLGEKGHEKLKVELEFSRDFGKDKIELFQNTPNPFTDNTTIGFYLPSSTQATLTIQDASGRVVKTIKGDYKSGFHEITIYHEELPQSGIWQYTLQAGADIVTKQMVLLR